MLYAPIDFPGKNKILATYNFKFLLKKISTDTANSAFVRGCGMDQLLNHFFSQMI